ncbi:hypothetical protein VDR65_10745 [Xanthomonas campestris pv. campestris]|nr:hypothetical protein [Xanthomonas campestris pv. campestris]MEB1724758.1 hypothetical protein [Xanthomonas campestris pv. campestris]MEB1896909.1 hypothetical protein [Xanthomonas campestris pv. campestris]
MSLISSEVVKVWQLCDADERLEPVVPKFQLLVDVGKEVARVLGLDYKQDGAEFTLQPLSKSVAEQWKYVYGASGGPTGLYEQLGFESFRIALEIPRRDLPDSAFAPDTVLDIVRDHMAGHVDDLGLAASPSP